MPVRRGGLVGRGVVEASASTRGGLSSGAVATVPTVVAESDVGTVMATSTGVDAAESDVGTVMATSTGVDVAELDMGTVMATSTGVAVPGEGSGTTPLTEQIARGRGRFARRVARVGFTRAIVVSSSEDMCVRALLDWLRISKQERQEAGRRMESRVKAARSAGNAGNDAPFVNARFRAIDKMSEIATSNRRRCVEGRTAAPEGREREGTSDRPPPARSVGGGRCVGCVGRRLAEGEGWGRRVGSSAACPEV